MKSITLSGVGRFVAVSPFDVAAETGFLNGTDRAVCEDGIERRSEITTIVGLIVAWTTVIQLSAIYELSIFVEQKEIRRAGGCVGLGYFLGLVKTVREIKAKPLGHGFQLVGRIVRMADGIIGTDTNDAGVLVSIVPAQLGQFILDMPDVGTMSADEHDEKCGPTGKRVETSRLAGNDICQRKCRGLGPER